MRDPNCWAVLDNGAGHRLFVKSYKDNVEMEYSKAMQIYEASLTSGYFLAPRPLQMAPEYGVILWEYLPRLKNLRTFLLENKVPETGGRKLLEKVLRTCGKALATIHHSLNLDDAHLTQKFLIQSTITWPELHCHTKSVIEHSPVRHLHGDFGCANVFISLLCDENPSVVVFDGSPNCFLYDKTQTNILGTIYLDLALFVASLNSRTLFYLHFRKYIRILTEHFLKAYEEASSFSIDRPTIFACAAESLFKYREYQKKRAPHVSFRIWWEWWFRGWSANRLLKTALDEMITR